MPGTECIILRCLEDGRHRHIRGRIRGHIKGLHGLTFLGRTYDAVSPDDQVSSQRPDLSLLARPEPRVARSRFQQIDK